MNAFYSIFRIVVCLALLAPQISLGQATGPEIPSDKAWFTKRLKSFRSAAYLDSATAQRSLDSLRHWTNQFGTDRDADWLTLSEVGYHTKMHHYPEALRVLNGLLDEKNDPFIQAQTFLALRDVYGEVGAFEKAIKFHNQIDWNLLDQHIEKDSPSSFLAFSFFKNSNYLQAIPQIKKAIEEVRTAEAYYFVVSYSNSLGVFYLHNHQPDSAIHAFRTALSELDRYFPNGEGMNPTSYQFLRGLIQGNIGQALARQGRYYEAIPLLKMDIDASLAEEMAGQYRRNGIISLTEISACYLSTDQLPKAEVSVQRAEALMEPDDPIELQINLKEVQAQLLHQSGQHEAAYNTLEWVNTKRDSLDDQRALDRTSDLLDIYAYSKENEIEKRMNEIVELQQRTKKQERFNYVYLGLILLAVLISAYSTYMYRLNKSRREAVEKTNKQNQHQRELLEQALLEQETLLREVNHRVKNNLQVIASMLFLEQRKLKDQDLRNVIRDIQERVHTMSNIHQRLYQTHDLDGTIVLFEDYVRGLMQEIISSYQIGVEDINLKTDINLEKLPIDQAVTLSFILHELTTNSLKHAFEKETKGTIYLSIDIELEHGKQWVKVRYKDDGKGIQNQQQKRSAKGSSIGIHLVELLSRQLRATTEMSNENGFLIELRFLSQDTQPTFAA